MAAGDPRRGNAAAGALGDRRNRASGRAFARGIPNAGDRGDHLPGTGVADRHRSTRPGLAAGDPRTRARHSDLQRGEGATRSEHGSTRATPPAIWVKHDHSYDRALARLLGHHAATVIATAAEVGEPTGRQDLIIIEPPRPADPYRAQARDILHEAGWTAPTPLTLGMATRLVPYKGVDLAIRALADPRCADWSLLAIGDDDPATPGERRRLLDLAAELGVSQRVCVPGGIRHAGQLLGAVDAVGVLTRPGQAGAPTKEGYGIVATEAMLAGVPVIVAQAGPISRRLITAEGPAGITLAAPSAQALAGALALLSDATTRQQMGRCGSRVAHTLPDEDDVAQAFAEVLAPYRRP